MFRLPSIAAIIIYFVEPERVLLLFYQKGVSMSNFKNVQERINDLGYYFADEDIISKYTDVNDKYNLIDKSGYKYYCCLKHLFRGSMPNIVGTTNPYSIENIKLWIDVNKKKYTLLSTSYTKAQDYLILKCNDCGVEFKRSWNNLKSGNGCRICRYNNQRILQMRPKKKDSLSSYPEICLDWSIENERPYTDYSSGSGYKAHWKCHTCNYEWETTISHRIKDKSGCPKCANKMSKAEKYIYDYMTGINLSFFKEYTFNDCRDVNPLPFDFYVPDLKLCIEYDGIQHFQPVRFSKNMTDKMAQDNFIKAQRHDKIKNDYCANNNLKLIRISYKDNLETRLNEIFESVA